MPVNTAMTGEKPSALKSISRVLCGITIAIGAFVLIGWQFNLEFLKTVWSHLVPVNPLTALLFIASGVSAYLLNKSGENSPAYKVAKILAAIIMLTASLKALSIFGLGDFGLDQVLFHQRVIATGNHMAPITAINFVLIGLALLVIDFRGRILRNPTHFLVFLSLFLVMLSFLGYLFGVITAYEVASASLYPIAVYSIINFLMLDLAVLLMRPNEEFIRLMLNRGPAGITMRRLIPIVLAITVLLGWIRYYVQEVGILNYQLLLTMTVTTSFFITAIVIWWNAKSLITIDEERKDASALMGHERRLLQSVISSVGEAIVVVDQKFNVLVTNKTAAQLIDMEQGELIGKDLRKYITFIKNDKPLSSKERLDAIALQMGKSVVVDLRDNVYVKNSTGKVFPLAGVIAPLKGGEGIKGLVAVFRDISKDKEIDIAKTEFVSLASHQLRTPLSTINWYSEILKSGDAGPMDPKQSEYLDEIMHANKRMVSLVNSLLNVSQIELGIFATIPQPINVINIARIVLEELGENIAEKKLVIEETFDNGIPNIMADPNYIKIVLQNLISNAVNYSPTAGKIKISIGRGKKGIVLKVSDAGYGIPEAAQSKIFLKLFRADNTKGANVEGIGLGLYLVKLIVDRTGGTIRFESGENRGTTFFVTLPLEFANKEEAGQKSKSHSGKIVSKSKKGRKIILVIEDEAPLLNVIKTKLIKSGFEVVSCRNANSGLKLIADLPRVDLVWLDHYLIGKETGLEFIETVQRVFPGRKIPIFVVSDSVDLPKINQYMELGAGKFYTKSSFSLQEIIDDIKKYI